MSNTITYDDFVKVDMRVGEIMECVVPEWSEKLLEFRVNLGEEIGMRTIFSAIRKWYDPEFFVGKKAMFVVNLAPKKMGEFESQGMMIMCDSEDKPEMIFVNPVAVNGTVVR